MSLLYRQHERKQVMIISLIRIGYDRIDRVLLLQMDKEKKL